MMLKALKLGLLAMVLLALPSIAAGGMARLKWRTTYEAGSSPTDYAGWWETSPIPSNVTKDFSSPGLVKIAFNNQAGAAMGWSAEHEHFIGYPEGPRFNIGVRVRTYGGKWGTTTSDSDRWLSYHEGTDGMEAWLGYLRTSYSFVLEYGVEDRAKFSCGRKSNGSGGWTYKHIVTLPVEDTEGWHAYAVDVDMATHKARVYFDGVLIGDPAGYEASVDVGWAPADSSLAWGAYASTNNPTSIDYDDFWLAEGELPTPNVSRGHQILLRRGLQINAQINVVNDGYFDAGRWASSNFTTLDLSSPGGGAYPVAAMPPPPGPPWSCICGYTALSGGHDPYIPSLVRLSVSDEQDITSPSMLNQLQQTMTLFRNIYPHVIAHTNQGGAVYTAAQLRNYMQHVQPDMLMFDTYPFIGNLPGGSPTRYYRDMEKYRRLGLEGNDGTGTMPIPVASYLHAFIDPGGRNNHAMSESEIRLNQFASWAFGCKFLDAFLYNWFDFGPNNFQALFFTGTGTNNPTPAFYQVALCNQESLKLGEALTRLINTDARMVLGRHRFLSYNLGNRLPDGVSAWDSSAGPYITAISATNTGTRNNGLEGDVLVGYFKPLEASFADPGHANDVYFMIVNGLSDDAGTAAETTQEIRLDFDFGASGITSLQRVNRYTGAVETVSLVPDGGSRYHLILSLPGGTGDLFKFNTGGIRFVTAPANEALPPVTVQGTVVLGDYLGDPSVPVAVKVELRQEGTPVVTAQKILDSNGHFTIESVAQGTYDVAVKSYGHLQKILSNVTISETETDLGPFDLLSGDSDGDNEVTTSDLATVLLNMDQIGDP